MRIGTANIRNFPDMRPRQVREDARAVALHTDVCGLQEIQPREDTEQVRKGLGPGWALVGAGYSSPIAYDAAQLQLVWHLVDHWHRRPVGRPEDPRPAVVSALFLAAAVPFVVVNFHAVSGGYNGQHLAAVQDAWDREWKRYKAMVDSWHHLGLTVYPLGDLNHPHPPELGGKAFRWLTPAGPADHIGELVGSSCRLLNPRHSRIHLNSDHPLHVVTGTLMGRTEGPGSGDGLADDPLSGPS